MNKPAKTIKPVSPVATGDYTGLLAGISELLEAARRASARTVNAFMTATYWEVGRRIVEFEQGGEHRAEYGTKLIEHLSTDLTRHFGRGFGQRNVECMRKFFLVFPTSSVQARLGQSGIPQTLSAESAGQLSNPQTVSAESPAAICQTPSEESAQPPLALSDLARAFPLPWSQYVLLVQRSRSSEAFAFYHAEALRGGWSVRQLQRQIDSQYRVDLLFFHRRLRCLVIFDLKLGRFTHADAGQMHLYLNYAREQWSQPGENPPVGVILCSGKSEALVRYATDALPNKMLVREYLTALPNEKVLAAELEKTRKQLEARK